MKASSINGILCRQEQTAASGFAVVRQSQSQPQAARHRQPTAPLQASARANSAHSSITEREKGLTLIELMITMALMSIVLVLGIPSFQEIIKNNRLTTATNALVGSLNLSRSEAIKRNVRVTVCKSSTGAGCTDSGTWDQGWMVFTDPNNSTTYESDAETLLFVWEGVDGNLKMTGEADVANYVSYIARGSTQRSDGGVQSGTIKACDAKDGGTGRRLRLAPTGRVQVAKESDCS
jgi:type IV fimbrial biogenesis protein FimT